MAKKTRDNLHDKINQQTNRPKIHNYSAMDTVGWDENTSGDTGPLDLSAEGDNGNEPLFNDTDGNRGRDGICPSHDNGTFNSSSLTVPVHFLSITV
uniref:Uncharacterized protein n=1 Tax=Oryza meridionalis TaxID=40149 RepID=A0A0E0BYH8_9ORYZ